MMMGRRFIEVVGPMAEEYFLYCEEVEWCLRGVQRGMRLALRQARRYCTTSGRPPILCDQIRRRPRTPVYLNERNKILDNARPLSYEDASRDVRVACADLVRFGRHRAWRQVGYGLQG